VGGNLADGNVLTYACTAWTRPWGLDGHEHVPVCHVERRPLEPPYHDSPGDDASFSETNDLTGSRRFISVAHSLALALLPMERLRPPAGHAGPERVGPNGCPRRGGALRQHRAGAIVRGNGLGVLRGRVELGPCLARPSNRADVHPLGRLTASPECWPLRTLHA